MTADRTHTSNAALLYHALGEARTSIVRAKVEDIHACAETLAILVHGSFSRGQADELSDLDLIVVVNNHAMGDIAAALRRAFQSDPRVAASGSTARFPWFGQLEAAIYEQPRWFALEIGLVERHAFEAFFVEPDALILLDRAGIVARRREACLSERQKQMRQTRQGLGYELLNLALKFEKALRRGHLWSAYNHCAVARRLLFESMRSQVFGPEVVFVGFAERRIESELPPEFLAPYAGTAPHRTTEELVPVFLRLFDAILDREGATIPASTLIGLRSWKRGLLVARKT